MIVRRAELVAAVDDRDLVGELRQEDRLLHRRVAAADDEDFLLAVEGGVADGAVRDARALEALLGGEPELPRGRTRGDDHRLGQVFVVADADPERALGEVDGRDVVGEVLGAEALGLLAESAS